MTELCLKNDFRVGGSEGGHELYSLINFDHLMDFQEKLYISFHIDLGSKNPLLLSKL